MNEEHENSVVYGTRIRESLREFSCRRCEIVL